MAHGKGEYKKPGRPSKKEKRAAIKKHGKTKKKK